MERMADYQRMREVEAGRPVPAELACLETRVRARAAERPRRRRGPVLAAVCLCLVLGTGMAWGMGGFAALDRLLGENAGQLIPFYQEVGETVRLEYGMVEIQGVTFTSHSCTVVYRLTAPNGEEAAETPPFYWKLIQGEAGPKESPFSSFVEPSRNGQDLGGNLGWEEVLEGEKRGSTYQVFTVSVEEDMSQVEDPKLLLYFSRAVDGVPSADDVPGGTLLTIPAEEVLEERVVRVPGDGEIRQVRVSPALISAQTAVPAEGNPVNLEVLREAPEIRLLYRDGTAWELEQEHVFQKEGRPDYCANAGEDGLLILNWFLREAPPDLEDLEAVEVNGIRCPVE